MRVSLQDIFVQHMPQYVAQHKLCPRERRAAWAISNCFTPAMGAHLLHCPTDGYSRLQYHACRHRSCPKCSNKPRQAWVESQLNKLLPCQHFHVVFTLPHVLLPLWRFNRAWFNRVLFDCARQCLITLCADPKFLGALPGILMSLHSWGRDLSEHPHIHCLVTAGGLDPQNNWLDTRNNFLLPAKVLSSLFRGKLLHHLGFALRHLSLRLPPESDPQHWRLIVRDLHRKHWNVHIGELYPHGKGVALYLARYVKGGPLPSSRQLHQDHQHISFGYTSHRDGKAHQARLRVDHFIARILTHVPPKGQHTVRHCGLYASSQPQRRQRCLRQLRPSTCTTVAAASTSPHPGRASHATSCASATTPTLISWQHPKPMTPLCPHCNQPMVRTRAFSSHHRIGAFSDSTRLPHSTQAQLGVEPDKPNDRGLPAPPIGLAG